MKLLPPFLLGLALAAVLVLIIVYAEAYHRMGLYWLGLLPVLALFAAAVSASPGDRRIRLLRGALGFAAAAVLGTIAFLLLRAGLDWFRGLEGGWARLILLLIPAVPGSAAAAAESPHHGLALAGGFTAGMCTAIQLARHPDPGLQVLLILGTLVGLLVHRLLRSPAR